MKTQCAAPISQSVSRGENFRARTDTGVEGVATGRLHSPLHDNGATGGTSGRPAWCDRSESDRSAMRTLFLRRRSALTLAGGGLLAGLAPLPAFAQSEDWAAQNWEELGADVKAEFKWAWDHYVERARGKDEINPGPGTCKSFSTYGTGRV